MGGFRNCSSFVPFSFWSFFLTANCTWSDFDPLFWFCFLCFEVVCICPYKHRAVLAQCLRPEFTLDFLVSAACFAINTVYDFQIKWLWNILCQVDQEERGILVGLKEELKFPPVPDVCHTFMWRMRQDIRHQLILTFPQPTARSCHVAVLSSKGWTLAGGCYFLLKLASLALKISTYENTKNVFLLFREGEKNV